MGGQLGPPHAVVWQRAVARRRLGLDCPLAFWILAAAPPRHAHRSTVRVALAGIMRLSCLNPRVPERVLVDDVYEAQLARGTNSQGGRSDGVDRPGLGQDDGCQ